MSKDSFDPKGPVPKVPGAMSQELVEALQKLIGTRETGIKIGKGLQELPNQRGELETSSPREERRR
jgi:hypothetical protein